MLTTLSKNKTQNLTALINDPTNATEKLYDMGAINDMAAGNTDFVLSLVKIFLDTIPANSSEMVKACNDGHWDMVSKLAHKLKSTVDMMRMRHITQEIRMIEMDAKSSGKKDHIPALVNKVNATIQKASEELRKEFSL